MTSLDEIRTMLGGKTIERLFILVFPPEGETDVNDVDIAVGFVFNGEPTLLYKLGTDINDFSPIVGEIEWPKANHKWSEYEAWLSSWMTNNATYANSYEYEAFEVTKEKMFSKIVNHQVKEIHLLYEVYKDNVEEFGLLLTFDDDYILVSAASDGPTTETSMFNKLNNPQFRGEYCDELIWPQKMVE